MENKDRIREMSDRYLGKMKVARDEAEKAFNKSMSELDRIGNEMYEEMRGTLKDGGIDIDRIQVKMKDELTKDRDELAKDFWKVQSRLVKFGEDVENEVRKHLK